MATTPLTAIRQLGLKETPAWAKRPPEIGFTKAGDLEWRFDVTFLSSGALVPLAHLLADGWSITVDRAARGLLIRISRPGLK